MKKKVLDRRIVPVMVIATIMIAFLVGAVSSAANLNIGWFQAPRFVGGATGKGDQRDIDFYPAVAYDAVTHRYLAVWLTPRNARGSGDGFDVYGVFLSQNGTKLGAAFRISDRNYVARSGLPTVAAGRGEFVVAWGARTNGCEVMVQKVTNSTPQTDRVLASQSIRHHSPHIVYNVRKNSYLLVQTVGDDYLPPTLFGASTADCGNNKDSESDIGAIEFVMRGNSPILVNVRDVSGVSAGAFRPRVAYNKLRNNYYVIWEDRRGAAGDFEIAVFGQILDKALKPVGPNKLLNDRSDYQNFSTDTTWTPRPSVAFGKNGALATWFEKAENGTSTEWQIAGKLLKTNGVAIKHVEIANTVYAEPREDRAPAGFLDSVFVPSIGEYLVVSSMFQDSFFGYLSTVTIQRVDAAGALLDLNGHIQDEAGVGTVIDYTLDDQLGAAVAVVEYSLPIADYIVLYSKHASNGHARDFDIWGSHLHIEREGLGKSYMPLAARR